MAEPALDFDVGGALKAGYTEHEIASYLGGQSGFDVEGARKAGYNSTEIIQHLAPPAPPPAAKEEVAPQPVSGTALGMAKAAGQTVLETVPKLEVGVGAMMKSAGQGEAVESRRDIDLMHRLDAGEEFGALMKSAPNDLARLALAQYRRASPEEKTTMRQDAINTVAAPPNALERGGANVLAAGQHGSEEAKKLIPLTPEEEGRTSVVVAKTAASLLTFLAAAGPAGVPGMVAYGGVESYGKTYEEAKKAGASDEDATVAAAISGVVQGGLNAVPAHKALAVADQIPKMFKGEFIKTLTEMAKSGGTLLGFTQVSQLADNYIAKQTFEPARDLKQGLGENMGATFGVGALLPVVPAVAARAVRSRMPAEVAKPVMEAKTTDEAIAAAQNTVAEGTPVDINEITRNAEYGTTPEQNQARLLKLFGGMNEGTVEQAGEGYHYRTEVDGQEQTVPLKVWDPTKPLAEGETTQATISPDLAAAQRKHYDSLGVKVVYFENDARIPFDGAVDPRQPDTIFLSNDPQRNAAQVGAHEITHLLESTKLPDGTNLGDLLHDQVRAGMTPEGRAYAEKLFGGTAPKREAFGPGVEGDSAHGDAVVRHIITELGADIGAEAPKFQTFAPRVVEAIEQRYGADAAKGVLQKLIAGFKNALDTMRNFFSRADEHPEYGQTSTVSQHWVTNLADIHDTLAKMYAERFGTQAEKENASLTAMREKVQRDRFLANFERLASEIAPPRAPDDFAALPAAAIAPEAPRPPGPLSDPAAYAEAASRAAVLRRWLSNMEEKGLAALPGSAQAHLLQQTEAAILSKVNGIENRLTQAQAARLEVVRGQMADLLHAETEKLHSALRVEQQRMADAASARRAEPVAEKVQDGEVVPGGDNVRRETSAQPTETAPLSEDAPKFSPRQDESKEPFYSALTRGVEALKLEKATPGQWEATIRNMPGVKAEERAWSGVEDWLKTQAKSVTKAEVLEHLRENEVQVREVEKRQMPTTAVQQNEIADRMFKTDYFQLSSAQQRLVDEALDAQGPRNATKFGQYTLPGGANYRELLLTLPERPADFREGAIDRGNFRSSHWDEPNVLAHVRFDDRVGPNGEKVLHLSEVQSDWHQKGRKQGYSADAADLIAAEKRLDEAAKAQYRRPDMTSEEKATARENFNQATADYHKLRAQIGRGVPDAPFKTSWPELALKRMIRYAAENGYDRLSWDTGETNAARYDLSKQVDKVNLVPDPSGQFRIEAFKDNKKVIEHFAKDEAEVANIVGKEVAEKLFDNRNQHGAATVVGDDLKVGGAGMTAFYDKQLPLVANKIGKKFGAKVEEIKLGEEGRSLAEVDRDLDAAYAEVRERQSGFDDQSAGAWDKAWAEHPDLKQRVDNLLRERDRAQFEAVSPAHSIAITPAMRESVMQGQPLFSPRVRTPEQIEADKAFATDKTVMEKLRALKENLPEKAVIATLDRFAGVKKDDPLGYMGLRLSNNAAGATEAFMTASTLRFDGRTYNWKERTGGVEALVKGLGVEAMDFAKWIAGHRAEILKGEGRENLLNDTQIRGLKSLNQGTLSEPYTLASGKTTTSREAAYLDALKKYHALNKNVLELDVESGLIKQELADKLLANPFYIPFNRVDPRDGDQFIPPGTSSGSAKQSAFKKLKGGTEQLNDLWENATSNWAHQIEAALKNKNTVAVLKTAVQQGAATKLTAQEALHLSDKEQKANTVWVMENGEKQFYRIEDKGLFAAVSVLDPVINIPVISPLARGAKNLLQTGVTMNPAFAIRNVIRDTQQVLATTPISWNVAKNLYTGFKENNAARAIENLGRAIAGQELKDAGMSDTALSALASGALMRFGDVADAGVRQTKIKVGNRLETPEAVDAFWEGLKTAGGAYRKAMAQSEDVSRIALFKQLKDQGLPTDFAAFSAKDIADFSLTGAAQLVRTLNSMSAFTNARMQGLYKVARSTADAEGSVALAVGTRVGLGIAKRVATVVLAGMLIDVGLDAIYANDEDWKKRDEFDKNSNYWFKIGKTEFRIPKGFEVGAVSRLGAIFVESFYDKEMTAGRALTNAYSLMANNLNLNPTPTAIKPLLDIYGNSNAASGNPIVPRGLERLQADQRYTINNTLQSRGISTAMNEAMRTAGFKTDGFSPIQIDYLARAYGGWLVSTSMQMGDTVARSFTSEPARPEEDRLAYYTGGIVSSEARPASRYVNMLYEQGDAIEKAYATYRDMLSQGHAAEAQKFFADNKEAIQKHGLVSSVMRTEGEINKQIRIVTNNPDPKVTPEQKHLQIQQLQSAKNRLAQQAMQR